MHACMQCMHTIYGTLAVVVLVVVVVLVAVALSAQPASQPAPSPAPHRGGREEGREEDGDGGGRPTAEASKHAAIIYHSILSPALLTPFLSSSPQLVEGPGQDIAVRRHHPRRVAHWPRPCRLPRALGGSAHSHGTVRVCCNIRRGDLNCRGCHVQSLRGRRGVVPHWRNRQERGRLCTHGVP